MKIQIFGMGVVGTAQAVAMRCLGHEINCVDSDPTIKLPFFAKAGYSDADVTFICTPESAVPGVISQFANGKYAGLFVIKSTVKPGTTNELMKLYDVHICNNPEFLRQRSNIEDALSPSRIVIGTCCSAHSQILLDLYLPMGRPIVFTTPTLSELAKLAVNSLRASIITYWNEMDELCKKLDVSTEELAKIVQTDKSIGEFEGGSWGTRFFGEPFGGKCLPKDLVQLIGSFRDQGLNPLFFEAVESYNKRKEVKDS